LYQLHTYNAPTLVLFNTYAANNGYDCAVMSCVQNQIWRTD